MDSTAIILLSWQYLIFSIMHKKLIYLIVYLSILSTVHLALNAYPTYAIDSFSLKIYPTVIRIQAEPPAVIQQDLTIENLSDQTINLDILFKPFTASSKENGMPEFNITNPKTETFIKTVKVLNDSLPIQSFTLYPNQKKNLIIQREIPEKEEKSDHYFSIQFISKDIKNMDETNYSQILGGVSANFLISIGKRETQGFIKEFSSPLFLNKNVIPLTIKLTNTGKNFIMPQGSIIIKNIFGHTIDKEDLPDINILQDSTRTISMSLPRNFLLGYYTATLNLSLSEQGQIFKKSISFFSLPTQNIATLIIIALAILLVYKRIAKKQRSSS